MTQKTDNASGILESITALVKPKEKHKMQRVEILIDLILQSESVTNGEESKLIYINQEPTSVQASKFLYGPSSSQETLPTPQNPQSGTVNTKRTTAGKKNKIKGQKKRPNRKKGSPLLLRERPWRNFTQKGLLFLVTPSDFIHSKISTCKMRSYLETKPSFTKCRSNRLRLPRLRVIVKDINEIWSLDLDVDILGQYNRDVKYFLVAVDCLSRYLRVETMKTKYATEAAQAFKKNDYDKQPWVDDGTEFRAS